MKKHASQRPSIHEVEDFSTYRLPSACEGAAVEADPGVVTEDAGAGVVVVTVGVFTELVELGV